MAYKALNFILRELCSMICHIFFSFRHKTISRKSKQNLNFRFSYINFYFLMSIGIFRSCEENSLSSKGCRLAVGPSQPSSRPVTGAHSTDVK